jgi:hypothetical protein
MKPRFSLIFNIVLLLLAMMSPQRVRAALSDGLLVHYDFETITNGVVYDASHHNNEGTLYGSPAAATGKTGQGLNFPSATDYLQLPTGFLNAQTSFSIACWVKISSLATWGRIFDFGSGINNYLFLTPLSGSGKVRFAIKNGGAEEMIDGTAALPTNEWVHVAVTFNWSNKGIGRLYVNGLQVGVNENFALNPSLLPQNTQNYIAKSQWPDPGLNGMVDDFRVYDRVLTDAEIMEMNGYDATLMDAYNNIAIAGDLTKVLSNLSLQTTAGSANIPVTWSTSAPDVVSTTGVVKRPKAFDANVTLTATISMVKNGVTNTLTKVFNLTVPAVYTVHWESMIVENDVWKYLVPTSEPDVAWYQASFNDATWTSAKGGIGFGDNDDTTLIATCASLYMRRKVNIPDVSVVSNLALDIDYDDAFILYLNGVEVARSSNVSAKLPAWNATLTTGHEATMYKGGSPTQFLLKPSMLVNGTNTVAVHILNQTAGSTDLSARVWLHIRTNASGITYHETPAWFEEPADFGSSNLPFVLVTTNGKTIPANNKIVCDMKVINNAVGLNYLTDTLYEFNGKIGIEIRGNSSANFPKKSYTVETRLDDTTNLNVPLLGLPKENDWVFHGPYPDKSLMRNALAYHLGNLTGKWSPRTRFFEMYLNGTYQGVYTLVEKIKIDKNRMKLATLTPADTTGDGLTGGYILKLDRAESTDVNGRDYWISPYKAWTSLQQQEYFLLQDPDGIDLDPRQFNYIKNYVTDFENAMYSDKYGDKVTGYLPKIDFRSFVDYYILTELSRNLDGYRISTFLHKDKDSKGGKLTMGPYWDYDISFGNADFFQAGQTAGWVIDGMGNADGYAMPFWWQKFRLDPYFNAYLKVYWNEWKSNYLNTTYLNTFIDSCATVMVDAQKRNFQTWQILTKYVWPNNAVPGSYAGELSYLKNWLSARITWMDSQIQAITDVPDRLTTETVSMDLVAYPNPFVDNLRFKFHLNEGSTFQLRIFDLLGRTVFQTTERFDVGLHELDIPASEWSFDAPVYLYQVRLNGEVRKTGRLLRNRR